MSRTHGMSGTREYFAWQSMKTRCRQNDTHAKWYSDRHIGICVSWEKFENFFNDMGKCPAGMTLERKNGNYGYGPYNCEWATAGEQSRNRRTVVLISFNGKNQCASEWAREIGINRETILQRLRKKWPLENVLSPRKHVWVTKAIKKLQEAKRVGR